ncbi:hypothetical protein [Novilysobacter arseniciresistens]|nr:hypothetical protein [Lysobacter arseniciresistens]
MSTDLYGNPLGRSPTFELNVWQKRQATLLYHFTSLDYLKGLKQRIDALIKGSDVTLDTAIDEGRDRLMVSERWGGRDTAANWSTYGFPALVEWQQAVTWMIAQRTIESYCGSDAQNCAGKLRELSMRWATPEEEEHFQRSFDAVFTYASYIDGSITRPQSRDDGAFYNIWHGVQSEFESLRVSRHSELFPRIPRYRVRTDVEAVTGRAPPRTGVYVPQDDPAGALQFCWTGGEWDGSPDDCVTFNALGREAINAVGREHLWKDSPRLLAFVKARHFGAFEAFVRESRGKRFDPERHLNDPTWATIFISSEGRMKRPCKWYYVEVIEGDFEEPEDESAVSAGVQSRIEAGRLCPRVGYWFTPAKQASRRYFKQGEVFPEFEDSAYGATFWQWSPDQSAPKL